MSRLQQGAVLWADLPPPAGRRPVVILTRDAVVHSLNALTVAPITRTIRNIPTEVLLAPADGVPTTCVVALDSILTIDRRSLGQRITLLPRQRMLAIFAAIRAAFDMP